MCILKKIIIHIDPLAKRRFAEKSIVKKSHYLEKFKKYFFFDKVSK